MQALQNQGFLSSDSTAMDDLQDFLRRRRQGAETHEDFAQIEQEVHCFFVAVEREALGRELEQFDLDVPRIEIDGERYDQVLRCETKAGPPTHPITVQWSMFESSVVYSSPQWGTQRVPLGVACRDHRRRLDTAGREASQLGGSPFAPKRE